MDMYDIRKKHTLKNEGGIYYMYQETKAGRKTLNFTRRKTKLLDSR